MTADTPTPAPPGPAGRQAGPTRRRPLRILAVAVSLLLVAVGALALISLLTRSTEHRSATYAGITTLDVDLAFESLQVTSSEGSTVTMDRSYSWSLRKPTVAQHREGDRLFITSSGCGFSLGLSCSGKVRLVVPKDVTIRARARNNGLTLRHLTGDIDAATSNGSVEASDLSGGQVGLRTSNGHIEASALRSARVEANTSNGAVRLSFDAAPAVAAARSSNGSVEVLVPLDGSPYRVTATTSNGATEVTVPTDPSAPRTIEAHTSNGAVRVLARP